MPSIAQSLWLRVGAKTHPGLVRSENQDRMSRVATPLGEVFIVADGVGGHRGGATAAMMAIAGLEKYLQTVDANEAPHTALQQAAQRTNAEIHQLAYSGDPTVARMGSTVVLALVLDRQLIIGHAGDSRAYLYRDGQLQRLTRDHSMIQKMVDHHLLTEEEARDHPEANVIDRAFGQKADIELELSEPLAIKPGDGVLLCSDGLCGYVEDALIERVLSAQSEAQQMAENLVELALAAGGADNITVQFLQFDAPRVSALETSEQDVTRSPQPRERDEIEEPLRPRSVLKVALMLLAFFLFGMFVMSAEGRIRSWFERLRVSIASPSPTPSQTTPQPSKEDREKNKEAPEPAKPQPSDAPARNQ